ncbi:MAG: hypothetical protein AAF696_05260, partial [Bacteroidota bacterium]
DIFSFHIPEHFYMEAKPEFPQKIEEDFGSFEINLEEISPKEYRFTRKFELKKGILPADRYEDYRNFFKKISKMDRMQMVLANRS